MKNHKIKDSELIALRDIAYENGDWERVKELEEMLTIQRADRVIEFYNKLWETDTQDLY